MRAATKNAGWFSLMTTSPNCLHRADLLSSLRPLVATLAGVGGLHLSLVGSSAHRKRVESEDVDVSLVLDRYTVLEAARLVDAAHRTCRLLEQRTYTPWLLEMRRGPFKPAGRPGSTRQLHLLIDDSLSIHNTTESTLLNWDTNGEVLLGAPLHALRHICIADDIGARRATACAELSAFRGDLRDAVIRYRAWRLIPRCALETASVPISSEKDALSLLAHVTTVTAFLNKLVFASDSRFTAAESDEALTNAGVPKQVSEPGHVASNWVAISRRVAGVVDDCLRRIEQ